MKKKIIRTGIAVSLALTAIAGQFMLPNSSYEVVASDAIIGNNAEGIPDTKLYAAVLAQADTDGNGVLTEYEAAHTEELQLSNMGIANLEGMEYFIRLTELDLSHNEITDISPLEKTLLQVLDLSYNKITDISSIEVLNELQYLDLRENEISVLPENFSEWDNVFLWANTVCAKPYEANGICTNPAMREVNLLLSGNKITLEEAKAKLPNVVFESSYRNLSGEVQGFYDWVEVQGFQAYIGVPFGDIGEDGAVSLEDSKIALQLALGIKNASERELYITDLDNSGIITLEDANKILQLALGIK